MDQAVQVAGALLILAAFVAAQRGTLSPQSLPYLALNLAGSAILTVVAAVNWDLGFLLLEAVWALVSGWGLIALMRGTRPTAAH